VFYINAFLVFPYCNCTLFSDARKKGAKPKERERERGERERRLKRHDKEGSVKYKISMLVYHLLDAESEIG
jgi:hypothetical protein